MQNIVRNIGEKLEEIYPEQEIQSIVRLIIHHVTGKSLPSFLSDKNKKITAEEEVNIRKIVLRLVNGEPLQYILGETEFYGLPFLVNKDVLIPRPETEELVELIINENENKSVKVLDMGTGSGCIAITLAKKLKKATVSAWDISAEALATAVANAQKNAVDIRFQLKDIFSDIDLTDKFDLIVSNPPYVLDSEKKDMLNHVLEYEPHIALFVPDDDPLKFYIRIADIAKDLLNDGGLLYFEINQAKGKEVLQMLRDKGFSDAKLICDISGNDRIIRAEYLKK